MHRFHVRKFHHQLSQLVPEKSESKDRPSNVNGFSSTGIEPFIDNLKVLVMFWCYIYTFLKRTMKIMNAFKTAGD